jgi:hypothetical protein
MDIVKLNPFPSVAANSVAAMATDQLRGRSVHGLVFVQGGTTFTKAHMTRVRVGAGGKNFVNDITGTQLQDANDYDGYSDTASHVFHWFGDPTARTIRGQHLGDLDLSMHAGPLEIEVTIGAATAPTLQVYAIVGDPKLAMGIGFSAGEAAMVRALIRTVITESGAVSRKAVGLGLGSQSGARLRKICFFHANLTAIELKKQGVIKWEDLPDALVDAISADFGRVAQSGLYVVDRIIDGNQSEAESTVDAEGRPYNFQVLLTTSGADTVYAFADVHTHPALI